MKMLLLLVVFTATEYCYAQDMILAEKMFVTTAQQNNNTNPNATVYQYINNNLNAVTIAQIGNYNDAKIAIAANNSNVIAVQSGDNNYMNIDKNARDINQYISQSGSNNFISDFSLYSNDSINMTIHQQGNNLSVYNYGSNSISKDMTITQTGNSGTVYVFNR